MGGASCFVDREVPNVTNVRGPRRQHITRFG
jgi:hypothetical protein